MKQNKPITEQQLSEIKENFSFCDRDNNNQIDLSEFTELLKIISPSSSKEQAEAGFSLVDENNDGHIDLEEFIGWWQTCWWEY